MSSQLIHIEPVDLGLGWEARDVWISGGPIVLVEMTSSGQVLKSRLDTQKSMFIDPLPVQPDESCMHQLVDAVTAQF